MTFQLTIVQLKKKIYLSIFIRYDKHNVRK